MSCPPRIETLLKLLDDPNQQAASMIMAELLNCEDDAELDKCLAELQEADDPLLRRRVHQLESVIFLRRRRRDFAQKLREDKLEFIDGLVEIHLQWYDNDTAQSIYDDWNKLLKEAEKNPPENIEKLAYLMRKTGYSMPPPNDLQADYYCLGTLLDEQVGSDVLLCSVAWMLAAVWGLHLQIIQVMENFALIDDTKRVLSPKDGWRVHAPIQQDAYNVWSRRQVLEFCMSMLFLCAVSTDSFRYVNTIGACLGKIYSQEDNNFLPFPYNRIPNDKNS